MNVDKTDVVEKSQNKLISVVSKRAVELERTK